MLLTVKFIGESCTDRIRPLSIPSDLKFDFFLSFVILLPSHLYLLHVPVQSILKNLFGGKKAKNDIKKFFLKVNSVEVEKTVLQIKFLGTTPAPYSTSVTAGKGCRLQSQELHYLCQNPYQRKMEAPTLLLCSRTQF